MYNSFFFIIKIFYTFDQSRTDPQGLKTIQRHKGVSQASNSLAKLRRQKRKKYTSV